jgi:hypothetical protein
MLLLASMKTLTNSEKSLENALFGAVYCRQNIIPSQFGIKPAHKKFICKKIER